MSGKIRDFLEKRFGLVLFKKNELETKLNSVRAEERSWHEQPREEVPETLIPFAEDYSYLYESETFRSLENGKSKKKRNFLDKVMEHFTGGWTSRTSLLKANRHIDEDTLFSFQDAAAIRYYSDPIANSIISNLTHFTIGKGVKLLIDNDEVLEVVKDFRKSNKMTHREHQFVKMGYIEGESFIALYINKVKGDVKVRRLRPTEIVDVEVNPGDIETHLTYHQQFKTVPEGTSQNIEQDRWLANYEYFKRIEEEPEDRGNRSKFHSKLRNDLLVLFSKFGTDDEIRGRVPMAPVLKYLKYYEDWLLDRIRLNHERSKVVWIKSIIGRTAEGLTRQRRSPRGGTMLVENDNVKYRIENARLDANDAKEDGLAILYAIGSGVGLPIHILNQRSDQEVYASIRKADTPFSQMIIGFQTHWSETLEQIYRVAIKAKVDAGILPKTTKVKRFLKEGLVDVFQYINKQIVSGIPIEKVVKEGKELMDKSSEEIEIPTEDIPISIEFPDMVKEDPQTQASVLEAHQRMGIASLATLASKAGYNWQEELMKMSFEEPEEEPEETPPEPEEEE